MSESVRNLFASIARRYDAANNAISFGMHRGWKQQLVAHPTIRPGARVLDCACGTGDVAFAAQRRALPGGEVVGVDFTPEMIELAQAKVDKLEEGWLQVPGEAARARSAISFEVGDVLHLPYSDDSFDAAAIAFGIRNVDDPQRGLAEMARVVRPGGAVLVLESGMPPNPIWRGVFGVFQATGLWMIGGLFSGNVSAYRYLAETTRRFPSGPRFVELMRGAAPFSEIESTPLLGGVAWIYRGTVS